MLIVFNEEKIGEENFAKISIGLKQSQLEYITLNQQIVVTVPSYAKEEFILSVVNWLSC